MRKLFTTGAVEHYTQLNNEIDAYRACFNTALAMAIRNNGIERHPADGDRRLRFLCGDDILWTFANVAQVGEKLAASLGMNPKTPDLNQWWRVMELVAVWYLSGMKFEATGAPYIDPAARRCVRFTERATLADIRGEIDAGYMAVLGTYLPPTAGHIVCVSGYTDKTLILNDPFGDPNTGYAKGSSGDRVELRPDLLNTLPRNGGHMVLFVHSDLRNPFL